MELLSFRDVSLLCIAKAVSVLYFYPDEVKCSMFLSKGQWTYGPTYSLSIDTHIHSKRYEVVYFWVFYMKNSPKADEEAICRTISPLFWTETWVWLCLYHMSNQDNFRASDTGVIENSWQGIFEEGYMVRSFRENQGESGEKFPSGESENFNILSMSTIISLDLQAMKIKKIVANIPCDW